MKTVRDFSNSLLKRREIEAVLESDINPGFEGVKAEIIKEFKADEENIVVRRVGSGFGKREFVVNVFIYESKEDKEKIEPKKKEKKKAGGTA